MATSTRKPRGRPFKPGQSGNPGGRPKEAAEVKALAREHTVDAIAALVHWTKQRKDAAASVRAATELLNRGYGKPTQPIGVEDDGALGELVKAFTQAASR